MPTKVVKRSGEEKPYKIVEKSTGKVVGSSMTKKAAKISSWIRNKESKS